MSSINRKIKKTGTFLILIGVQSCGIIFEDENLEEQLYKATIERNAAEVERLLKLGANPDFPLDRSPFYTPFTTACNRGFDTIVELMISYGAKLNPAPLGIEINQPLSFAAASGHVLTCEILITNGALVDGKNYYNRTNLYIAVIRNQLETTTLLLENGADITIEDDFGDTPFDMACIIGSTEIVNLLINEYSANVNRHDLVSGMTPLMKAAKVGRYEVFVLLYENGADLNALDDNGNGVSYYSEIGENESIKEFIANNL